jgi:hypothetical protein
MQGLRQPGTFLRAEGARRQRRDTYSILERYRPAFDVIPN